MHATRAVATSLRCNGCRTALWRSFASVAGVNTPPIATSRPGNAALRSQRRAFTTSIVRQASKNPEDDWEELQEEDALDNIEDAALPSASSEAPVPWYLQEDAASRPVESTSPQAARQKLPDLPEHPPPMLQALLEQVSVELGIDDLSLLDLRHLDPPPALGANLLMIFGTARSEKHLHVSADRLCRWLRSTYKLSPNADGLLGRNELKINLRRKARKARMMSNVGASPTSLAADDGIRTDWVCVNVGRVEAAVTAPVPKTREDFVGFGSSNNGVNIVVQMLTEEKRFDLDLENLWNGVLKTDAKRNAESEEDIPEAGQNPNGAVFVDEGLPTHTQSDQSRNPQAPLQARGFHSVTTALRAKTQTRPCSLSMGHLRAMTTDAGSLGGLGDDFKSQALALAGTLEQLEQMSAEEVVDALGSGYEDRSSTEFLRRFYENIPRHPELIHYEALMELYSLGIYFHKPGYPITSVTDLLTEIQAAGHRIPESVLKSVLQRVLTSEYDADVEKRSPKAKHNAALHVLEIMQTYGYQVTTDDMVLLLQESFCDGETLESAHGRKRPLTRLHYNKVQRHRFIGTLDMLAIPLKQSTYLQLLTNAARFGDWNDFWHMWGAVARNQVARTPEMYILALESIAETNHQRDCINALRRTVPMMEVEQPPVRLEGDVAMAVMKAVEVADPEVKRVAAKEGSIGEWVRLWRRCQKGLRQNAGSRVVDYSQEENMPMGGAAWVV